MTIRKERGLSLLEVLVAIAILGMLMGMLLTMMRQENALIKHSAEMLNARLKAAETMEKLQSIPFEKLHSSSSLVLSELNKLAIHVDVANFHQSETLKKIMVTVKWMNWQGRERAFVLSTLRAKQLQQQAEAFAFPQYNHLMLSQL